MRPTEERALRRVGLGSLRWLVRHGGPLKAQVFRGGIWLFIGHGLARGAGVIKLVVLARLLTPADFGLVGIAMLLVRWFEQFSQTGFRQALVRTPGDIEPYLNTLWTVQVVRGFVWSAALFFAAPLAAWFFDHAGAQSVIRALAPLIVLRSLINPATVYLTRELNFQRLAVWNSCQALAGLLVAIPLALLYQNVWALIWPLLVGQLVHTLASYRMHPYRPRFALNRGQVREMGNFGKWIFWKNVLNALIGSVDGIAISKLYSGHPLWAFIRSQCKWRPCPVIFCFKCFHRSHSQRLPSWSSPSSGAAPALITLSAKRPIWLANLLDVGARRAVPSSDGLTWPRRKGTARRAPTGGRCHDRGRRAYLQILELTLLLALPAAAAIGVFPHVIVPFFLGRQWLTMMPLLQLLAVCGSLQALLDVARPMFEAVGRPDLQVKLQGTEAILSLALIPTLTFWAGLKGAALAVVVVHGLLLAMQFIMLRELIGLRSWEGLATLRQGSLVALPLLGFGLTNAVFHLRAAMHIGLGCLAVGGCAVLLWFFLQRHLPPLRQPLKTRG